MLLEETTQPQQQVFNTYGNPNLILNARPVRLTMLDEVNNKKKGLTFDLNDVTVCKGYESDYLIEEEELSEDEGGYFDDVYEQEMDYSYDNDFSMDFQNLSFHEMYEPQPIPGLTPDMDVKLVENDLFNPIDDFQFKQEGEEFNEFNSNEFNQFKQEDGPDFNTNQFYPQFDNTTPETATTNQFYQFDNSPQDNTFLRQESSNDFSSANTNFSNDYSLFDNNNDNTDFLPSPKSIKDDDDMMVDDLYKESHQVQNDKLDHLCQLVNPSTGKSCNKQFSRPYDLIRHQETIHASKKKIYRCVICEGRYNGGQGNGKSKTFSRNDALSRHIKVKHGLTGDDALKLINDAKENVEYIEQ